MAQKDINKVVDHKFNEYDTDRSGFLEQSEIRSVIVGVLKEQGTTRVITDQEVDIVIKKVDTDRDGKVSREELINIMKKLSIPKK